MIKELSIKEIHDAFKRQEQWIMAVTWHYPHELPIAGQQIIVVFANQDMGVFESFENMSHIFEACGVIQWVYEKDLQKHYCATMFQIGDKVEHVCKESSSGYPHDKQYHITGFCRMKDPTTREWVDGVCYSAGEELFVREKSDFQIHFQIVKNINHD